MVPKDIRITIDEILAHPWLQDSEQPLVKCLELDYEKMKKFTSYSRLKAVTLAFIAAQLPAKES